MSKFRKTTEDKFSKIEKILEANADILENILIGSVNYADRIKILEKKVTKLEKKGTKKNGNKN